MAPEPFIFLTHDKLVDIRCCKVKGTPYFCVKDFIRRIANRPMGPLDALQHWLSICLSLQYEHDIMNTYVYKFAGPYERPEVCVTANGLLIVLHHLDTVHELVNHAYRAEVNSRLLEVAEGAGDRYIEDHDDGEVDAQMGGEGADLPEGSRFRYTPTVRVSGADTEVTLDEAVRLERGENRRLTEKLARMEDELLLARQEAANVAALLNARIVDLERTIEHRYNMDNAFKLTTLIKEAGMDIARDRLNPLCKRVVRLFRAENPDSSVFNRKGVLFFMPDDREEMERIIRHEHLQMELEQAEAEHYVNRECDEARPAAGDSIAAC